jgi:hypothetical protein
MKTLFTITFAVGLLFSLGFIIFPELMISSYGIIDNTLANLLIRNTGATLLGLVVFVWFGIKTSNQELHQAILISMSVYWLVSAFTLVLGMFSGLFSSMGWITVTLHVGFFIAYIIFLFKK